MNTKDVPIEVRQDLWSCISGGAAIPPPRSGEPVYVPVQVPPGPAQTNVGAAGIGPGIPVVVERYYRNDIELVDGEDAVITKVTISGFERDPNEYADFGTDETITEIILLVKDELVYQS